MGFVQTYSSILIQISLSENMNSQMLLILTKSVNRCFEKNPKFDMAPLLGGTDAVFLSLLHGIQLVSFFSLLVIHLMHFFNFNAKLKHQLNRSTGILLRFFMHTHSFPLPNQQGRRQAPFCRTLLIQEFYLHY